MISYRAILLASLLTMPMPGWAQEANVTKGADNAQSASAPSAQNTQDAKGAKDPSLSQFKSSSMKTSLPRDAVGANGVVEVRVTVGTDGRPTACNVVDINGSPKLGKLACSEIMHFVRFHPVLDATGQPIVASVIQKIRFCLDSPGGCRPPASSKPRPPATMGPPSDR